MGIIILAWSGSWETYPRRQVLSPGGRPGSNKYSTAAWDMPVGISHWKLNGFLGSKFCMYTEPFCSGFNGFSPTFFSPPFICCGLYFCEPIWISMKNSRMMSLGLYYWSQAGCKYTERGGSLPFPLDATKTFSTCVSQEKEWIVPTVTWPNDRRAAPR